MRDLGFTVAFVLVTLSVLWVPIFIYTLVRKSQGREAFAYEPAEEPEMPAGQPGPPPWWTHAGVALIFILVLPAFLLMGLVFVPPVGLATLFWRMGERSGPGHRAPGRGSTRIRGSPRRGVARRLAAERDSPRARSRPSSSGVPFAARAADR